MNKKFGPAPDWLQNSTNSEDRSIPEATDPLKSLFSASRTARLGDEEDNVLLEGYRECLAAISDAQTLGEIKALIGAECKPVDLFAEAYVAPVFTGDVPDIAAARLVILNPNKIRTSGGDDPELFKRSRAFLDYRGAGPRRYRNSLVFVVADSARIQEADADVRAMLAWHALSTGAATKRMEPKQIARARAHHLRYREGIAGTVLDAFSWLLVPTQAEPEAHLEWLQLPLPRTGTLTERAGAVLKEKGLLRTEAVGLAEDIARVRAWLGDRVHAGQLAEEFACQLYLPRITDVRLLTKAIQLALASGVQGRPESGVPALRAFSATVALDATQVAQNTTGPAAELLALLLQLDPDQLRVTVHVDAQVSEPDLKQLETLVRSLRKKGVR